MATQIEPTIPRRPRRKRSVPVTPRLREKIEAYKAARRDTDAALNAIRTAIGANTLGAATAQHRSGEVNERVAAKALAHAVLFELGELE